MHRFRPADVFLVTLLAISIACGTGDVGGVAGSSAGGAGGASAGAQGGTRAPASGTPIAGGTGSITSAGTAGNPGTATGASGLPLADPNAAGPMPMLRLTNREYNNTVRDLLGDVTQPANQFASDSDPTFEFPRAGVVAAVDATLLQSSAETLATAAAPKIAAGMLLPCNPTTGEAACAQQFIRTFGQRAFRRPLAAGEAANLLTLYTTGRTTLGLGFADAIRLLIEAILQTPQFLYHWEAAPTDSLIHEGQVVRLGAYQIASRLSYFMWGSMPDDALLAAAAAGQLDTVAGVQTAAVRLLGDPKAKETVSSFFSEWLGLGGLAGQMKDPTAYPNYTTALQQAMRDETSAFVQNVAFGGDGRLATFLGAPYSYVNGALAGIYGVQASGTAPQRTNLNPAQRAGILTQASFLALTGSTNGSNPVRRGKAVYTKLLCRTLPPPPPNVPAPAPASAGGTTRQRFVMHDQNPCAAGCHRSMDPIGFAFENFDGIGQYRTTDNTLPVDATGSITLDGQSQTFGDAVGLMALLAKSPEVRTCFAGEWSRFGLSRVDTPADAASLQATAAAFSSDVASLQSLMDAVATMRSFRYRSLSTGETP